MIIAGFDCLRNHEQAKPGLFCVKWPSVLIYTQTGRPMQSYLKRILTARVYDVAIESPLEAAPSLSARIGNRVLLKREDMQPVFSFKLRGAYNKMAQLTPGQLKRGVITASAGNHAQGVAMSAQKLGCKAIIVVPQTTPQVKIDAIKHFGQDSVKVVLHGDSYSDAYSHALLLQEKQKLSFVHPFDDPDVIAGQGTIGMEILRQHNQPIHAIFCAIGGGGLISGVAAYVKQIRPEIKVIGVQSTDSDAMYRSLKANKRVQLKDVGLFADGTAVKLAGAETFRICKKYVDEILLVDTDAVCAAIKDVFQDTRSILEPSGALAVAGAKLYAAREKLKDQTLVTVLSGANMNFDRLHFVTERAEIGEQREAILAVTIPETPGSFRKFCSLLGKRNITEFNYRYSNAEKAQIFVGIQVRNPAETDTLIATLKKNKLPAMDLTDNEMAKLHLRHLVGGRAPEVSDEIMYRFEFPERPGALMNFLNSMSHSWNISLFHYRNHGADFGRVLIGMQVPHHDKKALQDFLGKLGYRYWDESDNPAYRLFLV